MPVARAIKAAVALSLTTAVALPVAAYTAHVEPRAVAAPPPLVAGVHMNAITTAMRDAAPPIRHRILGTDNGPVDALAGQYLSDVLDFWDETPLPQGKGFMLPPESGGELRLANRKRRDYMPSRRLHQRGSVPKAQRYDQY